MVALELLAAFVLIVGGAIGFTNAVEWLGHRLDLGAGRGRRAARGGRHRAAGVHRSRSWRCSAAAASEEAVQIAIGAIIGAPFVLGTLAMLVIAGSALAFRGRRDQGADVETDVALDAPRPPRLPRALPARHRSSARSTPRRRSSIAAAALLRRGLRRLLWRTVRRGGDASDDDELAPLYFDTSQGRPAVDARRSSSSSSSRWPPSSAAPSCSSARSRASPSRSASPRWCSRSCSRRWPPSCPRRRTRSCGCATARTRWRSATSPARWPSRPRSRSRFGLAATQWELEREAIVAGAIALAGGAIALLRAPAPRRRPRSPRSPGPRCSPASSCSSPSARSARPLGLAPARVPPPLRLGWALMRMRHPPVPSVRRRRRVVALPAGALLAVPRPAAAGGAQRAKPYLDSRAGARDKAARAGTTVAAARPSGPTRQARAALRRRLGRAGVLTIDPLTGTPRQLLRTDGALSGPRGGDRTDIAHGLRARQPRRARPRRGRPRRARPGCRVRPRRAGSRSCTTASSTAASPPSTTTCASRSTAPGACTPSPARRATTSPSPRSTRALSGAEALARLQRNVGVERSLPVSSGPTGARQHDELRGRRLRPARAVRRRERREARLARDLPRHLDRALRRGRRRRAAARSSTARTSPRPPPNAEVYPNHPGAGAAESVDLEDYGLAARLDGPRRRLGAPVGRRRRRQRRRRAGGGDAAQRGHRTSSTRSRPSRRRPSCPAAEPCALGPDGPRRRGRRTACRTAFRPSTSSRASTTTSRAPTSASTTPRATSRSAARAATTPC